ncbi:MAG: TauD/TfdA family dioxygenase [Pseudomonadales bacterium]|nr:TauD/TfdA family dioxygenase [Pseudomonadales bacterium]
MSTRINSQSSQILDIQPLSIHIGALVDGIDLTMPLSEDHVALLKKALLEWKVLFFRDQFLSHQQHIDFAIQFGRPTPGHVVFGGDETYPEIYSIAKERRANRNRGLAALRPWTGWHTDITAAINPPWASILRGDVVPPYGGDTQWTNLAAAYTSLSQPVQKFIENLMAEHRLDAGEASLASMHPLVCVHPETQEHVLYISPSFIKSIVGLKPHEGQKILEMLWEQAIRPEYTVRFKWEPGSVAFWDNRSTAHLAPADIFDSEFERQFYRVTLVGESHTAVSGESSRSIVGKPISAIVPSTIS